MSIIKSFSYFFILILIVGCSQNEQPTEIEKSIIEQKTFQCMLAINTQRGIPDDPDDWDFGAFDQMTGALNSMAELADDASNPIKNPTQKKWKVTEIDNTRKITMSFDLSDKSFDCDFIQPEVEWMLYEVKRNNEIVFNYDEDEAAKEENKELGMELKAERERIKKEEEEKKIMQWTEKGYSNVAYKYYEKRHVKSTNSFNEPVLKVDCDPSDQYTLIKYDHGGFSGKRGLDVIITMKDGSVDDSLKGIAVSEYGSLGRLEESEYSFSDTTDGMTSLMLGALAGSIKSLELDGFKFNFDDITQVPCIHIQ